eukprot:1179465-Prorocentrum_minimum.AAC.4
MSLWPLYEMLVLVASAKYGKAVGNFDLVAGLENCPLVPLIYYYFIASRPATRSKLPTSMPYLAEATRTSI